MGTQYRERSDPPAMVGIMPSAEDRVGRGWGRVAFAARAYRASHERAARARFAAAGIDLDRHLADPETAARFEAALDTAARSDEHLASWDAHLAGIVARVAAFAWTAFLNRSPLDVDPDAPQGGPDIRTTRQDRNPEPLAADQAARTLTAAPHGPTVAAGTRAA